MFARIVTMFFCLLALVACGNDNDQQTFLVSTPTPLMFTPLDSLVSHPLPVSGVSISTIAYLVSDSQGVRLITNLGFIDSQIHMSQSLQQQVWIDPSILTTFQPAFRSYGETQYTVVFAKGTLEGPSEYGDAKLGYQLKDPTFQVLIPEETNIPTIQAQSAAYEGRLVRMAGAILAHTGGTLFVDQIGEGGIPAEHAQQVKVRGVISDQKILSQLQRTPSGIYYGRVQVEGIWYQNQLIIMSIIPIS